MQLCTVSKDSLTCAVRVEANVAQVKDTCNDTKQVLPRTKIKR